MQQKRYLKTKQEKFAWNFYEITRAERSIRKGGMQEKDELSGA